MNGLKWSSLVRGLAWIIAPSFFVSTVMGALLGFGVFGSPPERGDDFVQFILEVFRFEHNLWPIEFTSLALTAIGFLALGALGPALRRLASPDDGRRGLVGTSFLSAGLLGALSELVWIGARPITTDPQYCDCGFLQEEIMARLMIQNVLGGVRNWVANGALVLLAVGLVTVARIGQRAGMPNGWRWLSLLIAGLVLVSVATSFFDAYPFDVLLIVLVGGVLAPVWALWLARRATVLWGESESVATASMPPG